MRNPLIEYIRCATSNYRAYYDWKPENTEQMNRRGMFMCSLKRDWELVATLYRLERRRTLLNRIFQNWTGLHP